MADIDIEGSVDASDDDVDYELAIENISESLYTSNGLSLADVLDQHLSKLNKTLLKMHAVQCKMKPT